MSIHGAFRYRCTHPTDYRELADDWVLLYNGETAIQDVAAGSLDQIAIRAPYAYSTFLKLVEDSDND